MTATKALTLCTLLALALASSATAEVIIQLHNGPLSELARPHYATSIDPSQPTASRPMDDAKVENPSTFYILGHFKIDSTNPFGETTFVTIRNEGQAADTPTLVLHLVDSLGTQGNVALPILAPRQMIAINLNGNATAAPDGDGFIRGWAIITSNQPISVDFFQVNTNQDFAASGTAINLNAGGFCYRTRSRFLLGGGFSGGTEITFMQDLPFGADTVNDPPSIEGEAYGEDGALINSFTIWTDEFSFQRQAEDLVLPGNVGGALEITFKNAENGFLGGSSRAEYKANDKFSANLKGFCLQQNPVVN